MAVNKIPEDLRLYVLHLVSLGVPRMTVARRYGLADSSIAGWQRVAAKPRYTQCLVCGEWIVHRTYGGGNRRKYCENECQRVMRAKISQDHRDGKIDPLCQWCLVRPKASNRQVCSDDCYRQRTNHRLAHGSDLWCVLPLCSECGLVKGINNMAGECRGCLATSSRRREARRLPSAASCELCGGSFFAFGRGWSKPKFCEECREEYRSAKRLERQRLSQERADQRRLEKEALPRPLCKWCLVTPIPHGRRYCSAKCCRQMDSHRGTHGEDLWCKLPLCLRCKLVRYIGKQPGYCRECKPIAQKEGKKRSRMQQKMSGKDQNRKEFYRSGDKISRQGVLDRTGYRCHLCKRRVRLTGNPNHALYFQVDHIIPRSKGGTHTWDNVATCCRSCNGKKGDGAANDQLRLLTVGGV